MLGGLFPKKAACSELFKIAVIRMYKIPVYGIFFQHWMFMGFLES